MKQQGLTQNKGRHEDEIDMEQIWDIEQVLTWKKTGDGHGKKIDMENDDYFSDGQNSIFPIQI